MASTLLSTESFSLSDRPSAKALQLPELLEHIASFLDRSDVIRSALVCKTWSPIFIGRLWHTLHSPPTHVPGFMEHLSRHGHQVRSFVFFGMFDQDAFFKSCPNLTLLDLTLAKNLNVESLSNMVRSMPYLRVVRLDACYGMGLAWLGPLKELEHLEELAFMNDAVSPVIEDMDAEYTEDADAIGADIMDEADLEDNPADDDDNGSVVGFPFVPIFDDDMDEEDDTSNLKPDYLGEFLVARASTLRRLSLEGSDVIKFQLFEAYHSQTLSADNESGPPVLALKCINLSKTSVYRTAKIVEPLLKQCPELEVLDISGQSWDTFNWSILPQCCIKLTALDVSGIHEIDNNQLVQVIWTCLGLRTLVAHQSNLESKVLDAIVERWHAGQGKGSDIQLLEPCPFLVLDISWCMDVEQESVERVVQTITTLKSLKFSWCHQIDMTIFQRPWCCQDLEELETQGVDRPRRRDDPIDEEENMECAMFTQVTRFKRLKRLAIGSDETQVIRDRGFGILAEPDQGLDRLEYLSLIGNEDYPLQEAEMEVFANAFPKLKLFQSNINLVSPEMQQWLSERRPELQQEDHRFYY
ncbi:hypothetical protein B0O80DRAFT_434864, partial [Mortierella sp. GBAus27b]